MRSCGSRKAARRPWGTPSPRCRPWTIPRARPEDTVEAFTAWAEARWGVEPGHLAELLDAVAVENWIEVEDAAVPDVVQVTALLADLDD